LFVKISCIFASPLDLRQPHEDTCPLIKSATDTSITLPQSHSQHQQILPLQERLSVGYFAVNLPKT
jgi:hypothetical protein